MSTRNSDQVTNGDNQVTSITKSLLASLSEITASVPRARVEQSSFIEIGSYFYRISPIIVELQTIGNTPDNIVEILQSLSECTESAKSILGKLHYSGEATSNHEVRTTIKQLQGIIRHIGEDLSSIPPLTFKDELYAETALRSLAEEMKGVRFQIGQEKEMKLNQQQSWTSSQEDLPSVQSIPAESDLYSISTKVCTENSNVSDLSQLMEVLTSASQRIQQSPGYPSSRSSRSVIEVAEHMEPLYKSFYCPLTKKIMDDPVTIQSGVTYERTAIKDYLESSGSQGEIVCPVTREKLLSMAMNSNIALRSIIQEWKDRNETARLKVIRAALSVGSTDSMVREALRELQSIIQTSPKKIIKVCEIGMIPLLVRLLEMKDRMVRCVALETIQLIVKEDKGKELIGKTQVVSATIRLLSSSYQPIRHAALLLLIELSFSQLFSEKIGRVTGAMLILIQTKYNRTTDSFASEAADQVLRNLEQCPKNIKLMAENGYLEPLLNNLLEGSEERKQEMATYLCEIILEDDRIMYVAERTSSVLIQMLQSGNTMTRKAARKALAQISSYHGNGRTLLEAGIAQIMVDEIFTKKIHEEPLDSLTEASAVLANILESGIGIENLVVNKKGHTIASGYAVFNILYMIKNSTPDDLNLNLIRILSCLTKSSMSAAPVVSAIKESEASYTLVDLLNNRTDEMTIAALRLLILLSPHIGHQLIDKLCKTNGQPEGLLESPPEPSQITEKQALSVSFLATLPHQNLTLNMALLSQNTVPGILQSIAKIRKTGIRQNRYARTYLEGLVGVLVRFTATLYDAQMLFLAINCSLTTVFTDLLMETSSDEVQRLAATGLEKLSAQSPQLSKPPEAKKKTKFLNLFNIPEILLCGSSNMPKEKLCLAHKGICSAQTTFCLIQAGAVERLLALDHQNVEVVEAALSALSTLLDDKVDIEQSVHMLNELNATQHVLKAVRYHKNESLWQKAFWMIERFLVKGGPRSISVVSQDRMFAVTVVTAFHHGDAYTRQMAEKILRYLDKMPSLTGTFTT